MVLLYFLSTKRENAHYGGTISNNQCTIRDIVYTDNRIYSTSIPKTLFTAGRDNASVHATSKSTPSVGVLFFDTCANISIVPRHWIEDPEDLGANKFAAPGGPGVQASMECKGLAKPIPVGLDGGSKRNFTPWGGTQCCLMAITYGMV